MGRVASGSLEVYRCSVCAGFYLDREEMQVLLGTKDSLSVRLNEPDRNTRHCFRCSVDMVPLEGPAGTHLDRCEVCEAVFLGGGKV